MKIHRLKIKPEYFKEIRKGIKTAEIRFDDRDFMIGDRLEVMEFKPVKKEFTGRYEVLKITGITRLFRVIPGIDHRWCMLSFEKTNEPF